jgi:DNA repair protein RadD
LPCGLTIQANYLRFRDDWDEVYEVGVSTLDNKVEGTRPEPTEQKKNDAKCPSCGFLWDKQDLTCPSCGHARPVRSGTDSIAGVLEELKGGKKTHKDDKQTFLLSTYLDR